MFLSVVMIDWGNLRGQIFSRTVFAPSGSPESLNRGQRIFRIDPLDCNFSRDTFRLVSEALARLLGNTQEARSVGSKVRGSHSHI